MSVQPEERPAVEIPVHGDLAFADLMDALVPAEEAAEAGAGTEGSAPGAGAAAPDADGGARSDAAPAAEQGGAGAVHADAGTAGGGAAAAGPTGGAEPGGAEGAPDRGAEQPAASGEPAAVAEPSTAVAEISGLSTRIEENLGRGYQARAYEAVRQEHARYFQALEVHPRLLVGTEVPSVNGEGMETLKDTGDAREWQEAVKALLTSEIQGRAQNWMQNSVQFMETVHAAVDLFTRNPDMIPGTKGFDRALADDFASTMQPYEIRVDGKLQGYSIPAQPIIDRLRKARQAPSPAAQAPAQAPTAPPPQAAIRSKAGVGEGPEDFSTLFGTIGLPQLRI